MKIIISHDVDHLFWSDHIRDLFYPKLWVRETLALYKRRISFAEWKLRMGSTMQEQRHYIDDVALYDKQQGVPSTFFFGMAKGLGMSYQAERALPIMQMLQREGFHVGVHGIAFEDESAIQREYDDFTRLVGEKPSGIRMHYVRFTDKTFCMLDQAGYLFDSTEFDKAVGYCVKAPYQVGNMWEFPLAIMDTYLPYDEQRAKQFTLDVLKQAEDRNIGYCTILLHDTNFSVAYQKYQNWYRWFIEYCIENGMGFISHMDAIGELVMKQKDA